MGLPNLYSSFFCSVGPQAQRGRIGVYLVYGDDAALQDGRADRASSHLSQAKELRPDSLAASSGAEP